MFNTIRRLLSRKFIEWDDYKERIDFLEDFYWQQSTRKQSISNMPGVGTVK